MSSIPPSSSMPHGFQSQIDLIKQHSLPKDLKEPMDKIIDQLDQIQRHAQQGDLPHLVQSFQGYDQSQTEFHSELNKYSNRGLEKSIKDKFETLHHHFDDKLNDITTVNDHHETSLRDALSSYDPDKLQHFLESLNKPSLHQLSDATGKYIQELKEFKF